MGLPPRKQGGFSSVACPKRMQSFVRILTWTLGHLDMNQTPQLTRMAKWMRKSSIRFFELNPDAIAAPGFVALGNKNVVSILSTGFEAFTRDSFFITIRAREILLENVRGNIVNETDIFQAENNLNALFDRLHDYFDTRIAQGEQKLQYAGFSLSDVARHTTPYETLSVTNAVTQYIDVLGKADFYLAILQYLWLTGELADNPDDAMRHKLTAERDVRTQLYNIVRVSNANYNNIRRICNGVLQLRREQRESQAARDRAIAKKQRKRREKAEESGAAGSDATQTRKDIAREKRKEDHRKNVDSAQRDMDALATA